MRFPKKGELVATGAALVVGVGGSTAIRNANEYHASKSDLRDINTTMQPYVRQIAAMAVTELHEHPFKVNYSRDGQYGEPTITIETGPDENGDEVEVGMPIVDGSLDPEEANAISIQYTPKSDCIGGNYDPMQEQVSADNSPAYSGVDGHAYSGSSQICVNGQEVNYGIGAVSTFEGQDVDTNPSDVAFLGEYALRLTKEALALPVISYGS